MSSTTCARRCGGRSSNARGQQLDVVRYDERGCGLSTGDDVTLGVEASVEELERVAGAHGAPKFARLGVEGRAMAVVKTREMGL